MWTDGTLTIEDNAPYVDARGTQYPGNFPKSEIAGLTYIPPTPPDPAQVLADAKANGLRGIDDDTDAIYGAVLGHRAEEYNRAAADAQAYKAAGYTGTVPGSVQSWATAKGWTATQAADDILATAAQWTTAQAAIRAARLVRKEQVRNAATSADVTAALAAWHSFCSVVRGQLGVA